MKKKSVRGSRGEGVRVTLSSEEGKKFHQEANEIRRLREAKKAEAERRSAMDIAFDSGEACTAAFGGAISFISKKKFIRTGEVRFGNGPAKGYYRETVTVSCSLCALTYDHQHKRFAVARREVEVRRAPPGDDWTPPVNKKQEASQM